MPADELSVLLVVCVLLAGAGALVTARWHAGARTDALGRRRGYPLLAAVCFELATLAAVPILRMEAEQHRLGGVATELAGVHAAVHCQRLASAMIDATADLGHVRVRPDGTPEHATLIKNEQCRLLRRYLDGDWRDPSRDEVVAVHVLTHESMHMRGITGEALAECAAVQRDMRTAELLGAGAEEARRLGERYWLTVYPYMPADYRTSDCGPGLPLDEHLPSAPWATPGGTAGGLLGEVSAGPTK